MPAIYIMRHGKTQWNAERRVQGHKNSPLLEEGRVMAGRMAEFFRDKGIRTVYVSPLPRCVETADIVCGALGLVYRTDERLVECSHGTCEGMAIVDALEFFAAHVAARGGDIWTVPWPGGESYSAVFARAESFAADLDPPPCLIIAHARLNACLAGALLGMTPEELLKLRQNNGTLFIIEEGGLRLMHLDADSA
ncbi:MAG: histidine phosphatase family protein [Desulfovibrio sp.]|jgi:probable phosphoglycerate mutase|nr:histidine phosphatase family protein [Desulfovibrio sp.]